MAGRGWCCVALGVLACATPLPQAGADIIGTVAERTERAGGVSLLVVQDSTRSAGYPRAYVGVGRGTRVLRRGAYGVAASTPAALTVGTRVEVWFTGAVAESSPVQATAATVVHLP